MKRTLSTVLVSLICIFSSAQHTIMPSGADTILNSYLVSIMHQQYAERNQRLKDASQTIEKLEQYKAEAKNQYKRLFSNFPTNIEAAIPELDSVGNIVCDKYNIHKIIISKRITANLYVPHIAGKKPAVLFLCGHEMSSKATESYQKTAILLAQNGFIVLVVDPSGQGERVQLIDENGKNLTRGSTTEHTLLSMSTNLIGWSEVNEMLLDNMLCVNYLSSRNDVDAERIGCIGNSGGGAQTTYLSAMDKRIKAVACCSWFTKRERMLAINGPDDGCQYLWNEGRTQLEIADYYIMQAPRPTLILAGTKDFIDYQGTKEAYSELESIYKKLDAASKLEYFEYEDGHGISKPKREAAVRFFKKYFFNDSSLVHEGELKTLSENALRCSNNGQILAEMNPNDALQKRSIQMAQYYDRYRRSFDQHNIDTCRSMIRQILNIQQEVKKVRAWPQGRNKMHPLYEERSFVLNREGEPDMPIRVLMPLNKCYTNPKVVIMLNDSGMLASKKIAATDSLINLGHCVILADPRGIGETKDRANKNNKKFYSEDYRNAALSLFIGRPLLGQRVMDTFSVIEYIKSERSLRNASIEIYSYGNIGLVAQHVAFLDSRVKHSVNENCIKSWMDILLYPKEKNRMSLLVANVLKFYDVENLGNK